MLGNGFLAPPFALVLVISVGSLAVASLARSRGHRFFALAAGSLAALALPAAIAIALLFAVTTGYRALTREEIAAVIHTRPLGPQQFEAEFVLPDGGRQTYVLAGDEIDVEARVLKWKPVANLLGLHTVYRLDRVSGRYTDVEHERSRPRTVYALEGAPHIDLFDLRRRYDLLAPLLDAEYGSGTFVSADRVNRLELRVSTSGLLLRGVSARFGQAAD